MWISRFSRNFAFLPCGTIEAIWASCVWSWPTAAPSFAERHAPPPCFAFYSELNAVEWDIFWFAESYLWISSFFSILLADSAQKQFLFLAMADRSKFKCGPETLKTAELEGPWFRCTVNVFEWKLHLKPAGLLKYPDKFWNEVASVVFTQDTSQALIIACEPIVFF